MGTELHYSPSFFTTLPRSHGNAVTIAFDAPDNRASSKDTSPKEKTRTGADPPHESMERLLCHKESLRKTMLEHEKIFKEQDWTLQVRELHRLYRTQKLLMSQLQNKELKVPPLSCSATAHPSSGLWSSASSGPQASSSPSTSNRHRHGAQLNSTEPNPHLGHRTQASFGSQELTICSEGNLRGQSGFGGIPTYVGDAQARSHISAGPSKDNLSTEAPPSFSDDECDLELTLSIGCGGSKKKPGSRAHSDAPPSCRPESSINSSRHRTPSTPARSDPGGRGDPSVGFDRESLQRPAWLFQGLSLNRT